MSRPPPKPAATASPVSEEAFVTSWTHRRQMGMLRLVYGISVPIHAGSTLVLPLVVHPSAKQALVGIHAVVLAMLLAGVFLKKRQMLFRRMMLVAMWVVCAAYMSVLAYSGYVLESWHDVMMASTGVMAYVSFAIILYPGSFASLLTFVATFAAASFPAGASVPGGMIWAAIATTVFIFLVVTRRAHDQALEREARQEYKFRRFVAPAHVVRRSLDNSETLRETFKPELKFCVCVATDWRDYQIISANLSPSQLTMTLNEYYALCERILTRCLPLGNYYTDWIADELFVVLYAEGAMTEQQLVDAALAFATGLIREKSEFVRVHSLPRAIDVGISAGTALLGMMGPDVHKKATALGEVPGRSRRFQGAGKLLRKKFGEKDRIIFGRECLMGIKHPFPVMEMALAVNESVRDVPDRELFYIEPDQRTTEREDDAA